VFDRFDERLRAPRPPAPPKVSTVELEIVAEPEAFVDDVSIDEPAHLGEVSDIRHVKKDSSDTPAELTYEPDDAELAELEAIADEGCGRPLADEELEAIEREEELTRQALIASGWQPQQEMRE
jgi:hypothetical protein